MALEACPTVAARAMPAECRAQIVADREESSPAASNKRRPRTSACPAPSSTISVPPGANKRRRVGRRSRDRRRVRRRRRRAQAADRGRALPARARDLAGRDIGRVRHDEIERPRKRRAEIRTHEIVRAPQGRALAHCRARARARRADVGADAGALSAIRCRSASRSAPVPVPRSAMRSGSRSAVRRSAASAASTTVSVSGRGTSSRGVSRSAEPQNSLRRGCARPARRASRRAASADCAMASRSAQRCAVGRRRRQRGVIQPERMRRPAGAHRARRVECRLRGSLRQQAARAATSRPPEAGEVVAHMPSPSAASSAA